MERQKLQYFPVLEFVVFAFSLIPIWLIEITGFWLPIFLTIASYSIFISTTNIIIITVEELTITFLNPFQSKHSIEIRKIKKITSSQTFELESDVSLENTYPILRKTYMLEYEDKNGAVRLVRFKLLNGKSATLMLSRLTKDLQRN